MGGVSDLALDRQLQPKQGKRTKKRRGEKANVPTELRDAQVSAQIAACISAGMSLEDATSALVDWNSSQPSPMRVGLLRKRVYEAFTSKFSAS